VTSDSTLSLFGGTTFAWSWNEGGTAGTSTSFKITSATGYGTLADVPTDLTITDTTVVVLNAEEKMYTIGTNLLVSDADHLNVAPATYTNATRATESSGTITIERDNTSGRNTNWLNYYISALSDTVNP